MTPWEFARLMRDARPGQSASSRILELALGAAPAVEEDPTAMRAAAALYGD